MRMISRPLEIVRANFGAYLAVNALAYGLLLAGFAAGLVFPDLTASRIDSLEGDGTADLVRSLLSAPWLFAATILAVNVLRIGVVTILVPSMIVPFAGIAVFAYWSVTTGVTLVPTSELGWVALIPHSLTVVIELQAYVLLVFGAFLLGMAWLRPATVEAENRRRGYVRGLQRIGWLSLPALVLLIVGAIYEAFSLIYLVPVLVKALI